MVWLDMEVLHSLRCVLLLHRLSKEGKLWHNQLKDGVGKAWEFLYVAVSQEATQGVL